MKSKRGTNRIQNRCNNVGQEAGKNHNKIRRERITNYYQKLLAVRAVLFYLCLTTKQQEPYI